MAVLEIYLEILTNFFEILHPPLTILHGNMEMLQLKIFEKMKNFSAKIIN